MLSLSIIIHRSIEISFLLSNIKLFSPLAESPIDDSVRIRSTVKRNHAMLEETSSTITVPASFMFRMLTSFYRLRRPDGLFGLDDRDEDESNQ